MPLQYIICCSIICLDVRVGLKRVLTQSSSTRIHEGTGPEKAGGTSGDEEQAIVEVKSAVHCHMQCTTHTPANIIHTLVHHAIVSHIFSFCFIKCQSDCMVIFPWKSAVGYSKAFRYLEWKISLSLFLKLKCSCQLLYHVKNYHTTSIVQYFILKSSCQKSCNSIYMYYVICFCEFAEHFRVEFCWKFFFFLISVAVEIWGGNK